MAALFLFLFLTNNAFKYKSKKSLLIKKIIINFSSF